MPRSEEKAEIKRQELLVQKRLEYVDKVFGRLTIIAILGYGDNSSLYCEVKCECGKRKIMQMNTILSKGTVSCGCFSVELLVKRSHKHGLDATHINGVWYGIKRRCYNKNSPSYTGYGAKGIKMCDEWRYDFMAFYKWCMENGWVRGLHVDRFPNKLGNYCPENCRISTREANANNKTNNVIIVVHGKEMTLSEASRKFSIPYHTLRRKIVNKKLNPDLVVSQFSSTQ